MAVKSAVVYDLLPDKTGPLCVSPIFTAVPIREGFAVTVEISLQSFFYQVKTHGGFREQFSLVSEKPSSAAPVRVALIDRSLSYGGKGWHLTR